MSPAVSFELDTVWSRQGGANNRVFPVRIFRLVKALMPVC